VATFQNERFTNQEIRTDGNRYEACVFTDCTLIYAGGGVINGNAADAPQENLESFADAA